MPKRLPNEYPRRLLLAVTGMSPQIVTETLYALAIANEPAFIPTEVHLITTGEGANRARLSLLTTNQGRFHQLCRDYHLPPISFDASNIHVICDEQGTPLPDIRSLDDNRLVADFITEIVRQMTSDDDCALHVSLAGGRKTMGYYLGYALSMFGRDQDCLSHVLVSENFESHPQFFYPTPSDEVIYTREGKPLNTREAQVMLASIDFIPLREELPKNALIHQTGFSETVALIKAAREEPGLVVNYREKTICASGRVLELAPAEWVYLAWFAERCAHDMELLPMPDAEDGDMEYAKSYLDCQKKCLGEIGHGGGDRTEGTLENGMEKSFFEYRKSYLNGALRNQLGRRLAAHYEVTAHGRKGYSRYGLPLEPYQVRIIE